MTWNLLLVVYSSNPSTWSNHLPWIEYAHNSLLSSATVMSLFQPSLGFQPLLFWVSLTSLSLFSQGSASHLHDSQPLDFHIIPTFPISTFICYSGLHSVNTEL